MIKGGFMNTQRIETLLENIMCFSLLAGVCLSIFFACRYLENQRLNQMYYREIIEQYNHNVIRFVH